ncbi:MAG: hypothetical protein ACI3VB_07670 [Oscillospiraceae bacterium]
MKRIRAFFRRHRPRWSVRILINLCLIAALGFGAWLLKGAPPLSETMALRRAETSHLIGPGEILARVVTPSGDYPSIIAVDEGECVALFTTKERGTASSAQRRLYYREKTGGVTLMAEPLNGTPFNDEDLLFIFAFDEFPEAVRAVLEIGITYDYDGAVYDQTFLTESLREYEGLFLFCIEKLRLEEYDMGDHYTLEDYAFSELASTCQVFISTDAVFPANVRFYGEDGGLLAEEETFVASRAVTKERLGEGVGA